MKLTSTFSKILIGFIMGAVIAGGVAVAVAPPATSTRICVDNQSKALYAADNGS